MDLIDERACFIAFNLVKGIGAVRTRQLLDAFGSLQAAWNSPASDLEAAGISPRLVGRIQDLRSSRRLEAVLSDIDRLGIQALTWLDDEYPENLRQIDQAPPVLYVRGSLLPADQLAVAVVGTRRVSAYGHQAAVELTTFLVQNGVTVISGLARGVDAAAHQTALQAGGRTLAVLGSGVDQIYPPEHRSLAEHIASSGALISDYPPGTLPEGTNFPPRNRIISGLALAVVVVEAGMSEWMWFYNLIL